MELAACFQIVFCMTVVFYYFCCSQLYLNGDWHDFRGLMQTPSDVVLVRIDFGGDGVLVM